MAKRHPTEQFFRLTPNVRDKLLECKLTAAQWRMWCYLVSLDPFGDRGAKFSPAELMLKCGIKKTAYFQAKAKFQKLGLFDFADGITRVFNLQGHSASSEHSQQEKAIESANAESQFANAESRFTNAESQFANAESRFTNAESKLSKPLPNKEHEASQTLQINKNIHTLQTEEGEDLNFDTEEQPQLKSLQEISLNEVLKPAVEKKKKSKTKNIPQDLISKLEELEIPLDDGIIKAIADHDISQAYGAVSHIEKTWETVNNPRAVFLYQISRQKVEKLGPVKKVYTARDFGWSLDRLKLMYPNSWREAALHFGVEIPPEEVEEKINNEK